MNRHQVLPIIALNSIILVMVMGIVLFFEQALAAPPRQPGEDIASQTGAGRLQFVSVSAMAFMPIQFNLPYFKDPQRQILGLIQGTPSTPNLFVAPLMLPDRSELVGFTVFGEDFDNQGEVRLRLKQCDHGQARCVSLAETTSTAGYNFGLFETARIQFSSNIIDNNFYSYFLELELTARAGSGLRAVRLEIIPPQGGSPSGGAESWSLSDNTLNFTIPNSGYAQVRICTDDLSHLNNATHYPFVVVDGNTVPLSSQSCVTVWGYDISVSRRPNTGPSSGNYQILR
jgi:hypothetical protein